MAMRETVRSLQVYFVLSSLVSGAIDVATLTRGAVGITAMSAVVGLCFAVALMYVGIRLRHLLRSAPGRVTGLLVAGLALLVVAFVYDLIVGAPPRFVYFGGALLITWYLLANVRRLAVEARSSASVPGVV
jgi:hypothetical protein